MPAGRSTDSTDAPRSTRALRVVLVAGLGVVVALVVADRVLAYRASHDAARALERFPDLRERVEHRIWQGIPPPEVALGPVEDAPAPIVRGEGSEREVTWTTWGRFPDDALAGPLPEPAADVVRVALMGHFTAADATPAKLQALLDSRTAAGELPRIEVVAAGLSSTDLCVTRLLAPRILARVRPHLAVVMHGSNDVLRARARIAALRRLAAGADVGPFEPGVDGLLPLYRRHVLLPRTNGDPDVIAAAREPWSGAEAALWDLSRLFHREGRRLVVATYVVPDLAHLDEATHARWDLELRYNYAPAGGLETYVQWLRAFDRQLQRFSRDSLTPLIDVRRALEDAGAADLTDPPHPTEQGATRIATALADGLAPLLRTLTPPARPTALAATPPVPAPRGLAGCDDARCVPGACLHGGTCFDAAPIDEPTATRCRESGLCLPVPSALPNAPAPVPTFEDATDLCAFRGGRPLTATEFETLASTARGPAYAWPADTMEWVDDAGTHALRLATDAARSRRPHEGSPRTAVRLRAVRCASAPLPEPR